MTFPDVLMLCMLVSVGWITCKTYEYTPVGNFLLFRSVPSQPTLYWLVSKMLLPHLSNILKTYKYSDISYEIIGLKISLSPSSFGEKELGIKKLNKLL